MSHRINMIFIHSYS